jgi:hypothetical protein
MALRKMTLLAVAFLTVASLGAQDIRPAGSGSIQGVKAGVTQNVRPGIIARGPGGERAASGQRKSGAGW